MNLGFKLCLFKIAHARNDLRTAAALRCTVRSLVLLLMIAVLVMPGGLPPLKAS